MSHMNCHVECQILVNIFQIRAARAWIGLSQEELADEAGVARRTVIRLENSEEPRSDRIMEKLQIALEKHGIEFLYEGSKGVGVRYREPTK
jgi:DNA-binding XRE family transcriptional regulator